MAPWNNGKSGALWCVAEFPKMSSSTTRWYSRQTTAVLSNCRPTNQSASPCQPTNDRPGQQCRVDGVMGPSYGPSLRGRQDSKFFGTGLPIIPWMALSFSSISQPRLHQFQLYLTNYISWIFLGSFKKSYKCQIIGIRVWQGPQTFLTRHCQEVMVWRIFSVLTIFLSPFTVEVTL